MGTPTNIVQNLRDAEDRFLNQFNEAAETSLFSDLVLEVDGTKGYAAFANMYSNAVFQKLIDTPTAAGLLTGKYEITTDTWKNPIRIPRDTLEEAEAIIGGEFRLAIDNLAQDAVHNRDIELTALLENNGNDVLGSAFFSDAGAIPNSTQTIDNNVAGTGVDTTAKIKADFFSVLGLAANMRTAAGRKYYPNAGLGLGIQIMYPSALEGIMQDTFSTQLVPGQAGATNVLFNKASLKQNTYLNDANNWYAFITAPKYPALVMATASGQPELQNNVPTGNYAEESVILTDSYLFAARDKFAVGYGSRYAVIRVTNS